MSDFVVAMRQIPVDQHEALILIGRQRLLLRGSGKGLRRACGTSRVGFLESEVDWRKS
jgi:hypothetical protein